VGGRRERRFIYRIEPFSTYENTHTHTHTHTPLETKRRRKKKEKKWLAPLAASQLRTAIASFEKSRASFAQPLLFFFFFYEPNKLKGRRFNQVSGRLNLAPNADRSGQCLSERSTCPPRFPDRIVKARIGICLSLPSPAPAPETWTGRPSAANKTGARLSCFWNCAASFRL
jgi:hypothetical protein